MSMTKILRSTTIIPLALYVPRDADRQLRRVIEDMGRPGYVLVARQMGKTNLPLAAKRDLEDEDNVFAYIDLSNRYVEARDCFRSIVDVATDTRPDAFAAVADKIANNRR